MKIDGKIIADDIISQLRRQVITLRSHQIIPQLAIILIGDNPASLAYIRQKQKAGKRIGVKISILRLHSGQALRTSAQDKRSGQIAWGKQVTKINKDKFTDIVNKLNSDKYVQGIIIQRPVPIDISNDELDKLVIPKKDVDGFHPQTKFTPPVASAVLRILEWVRSQKKMKSYKNLREYLMKKKITIIGRGETAGKPIAATLSGMKIPVTIAHSQSKNLKNICLNSDIIISCVGKPNIVRRYMVSNKTIIIGVGIHTENGNLRPDYNEPEISNIVSYYTPVPGGIGPVNVACLFENLIKPLAYKR